MSNLIEIYNVATRFSKNVGLFINESPYFSKTLTATGSMEDRRNIYNLNLDTVITILSLETLASDEPARQESLHDLSFSILNSADLQAKVVNEYLKPLSKNEADTIIQLLMEQQPDNPIDQNIVESLTKHGLQNLSALAARSLKAA